MCSFEHAYSAAAPPPACGGRSVTDTQGAKYKQLFLFSFQSSFPVKVLQLIQTLNSNIDSSIDLLILSSIRVQELCDGSKASEAFKAEKSK